MKFYDELNIATQKDRELLYSAPMIQDALTGKIPFKGTTPVILEHDILK